ncbi:hypothetical protein AVEN_19403-1 [Araneus ventricosus]|uniref:Uncharacterized protein n=1 Tax=Araneus ventricosus TaxID=182803 RepID=A0A4Y2C693_ARAVE|nr:hypothetical protein AVEN_19403-1 [Araneus ventricosus]
MHLFEFKGLSYCCWLQQSDLYDSSKITTTLATFNFESFRTSDNVIPESNSTRLLENRYLRRKEDNPLLGQAIHTNVFVWQVTALYSSLNIYMDNLFNDLSIPLHVLSQIKA